MFDDDKLYAHEAGLLVGLHIQRENCMVKLGWKYGNTAADHQLVNALCVL